MNTMNTMKYIASDTEAALLQLRYVGEETTHTVTVAPTGGTGSKLLVTIVTGSTTSTFNGAAYTTLAALIAAINALPGWQARRAHGKSAFTTNSDDFIALSAASVPRTWTSVLYRDISEMPGVDGGFSARIAVPDFGTYRTPGGGNPASDLSNNSGEVEITEVNGFITGATTAPYLDIIQDAPTGEVLVKRLPMSGTGKAAPEELFSAEPGKGLILRGPILLKAGSATASQPTAAEITVLWRPASN